MKSNFSTVVTGACVALLAASCVVAGCGGSSSTLGPGDGGPRDATAAGSDAGGGSSSGGSGGGAGDGSLLPNVFTGNGNCLKFGAACATAGDCCSGTCTGNVCSYPACTSDGKACATDGDCCSQACAGGSCQALNATCSTLGNQCTSSAQCCSGNCPNGTCQASSFCGQGGDSCATSADCCTGSCTIAAGQALGTCGTAPPGGPANCGMVDGVLCGGAGADGGFVYKDGGLPACGGGCCSRACAPFGPTGVLVCQPASGCHVVGDLCTRDGDCCGSSGLAGGPTMPVTCVITAPSTVGVCRNPMGCKPDGDVCKLKTMSCNASCDCCAGNCETQDTCKQDNVGVPRCAPAQCTAAGGSCASSASCCNGAPCTPNPVAGGTPAYVCSATQCVAACGACTNSADCCPGSSCTVAPGSARGMCGPCGGSTPPADGGSGAPEGGPGTGVPDGGAGTCATYGQICTASSDCCNGVPCSGGRCVALPQ